jgi:ankyrin repeat protein
MKIKISTLLNIITMDTKLLNACNGKTESNGGLNLSEFRETLSLRYPAYEKEIRTMKRPELQELCRTLSSSAPQPISAVLSQRGEPSRLLSQRIILPLIPSSSVKSKNKLSSLSRKASNKSQAPTRPLVGIPSPISQNEPPRRLINDNGYFDYRFVDALINKEYHTMKSLVLNGLSNINERDQDGNTVLHFLADRVDPKWVEWVINQGADVNVVNRDGITPLFGASQIGDFDNVEMLLKHGALPNIQDEEGNTALHANSLETGRPNITEILLQYGADPTITNHEGQTALDIAGERSYYEIEDLIINYLNTDIKEPDED